jgi:hypothetical protein
MTTTLTLADLPIGSTIEWAGSTWTVRDVRRHAMTEHDGTAWLILDGWKAAGMGDPPKPLLTTPIEVHASFA